MKHKIFPYLFAILTIIFTTSIDPYQLTLDLPSVSLLENEVTKNKSPYTLFDLENYLIANYQYNLGQDWLIEVYSLADEYGVNPLFAIATAHTESGFNYWARGAAGEIGMFQFMPSTAAILDSDYADWKLYDNSYSTELYFKFCLVY
jgi:hypothetical protein